MRLCVFCGSKPGDNPAYVEAAAELGRKLAEQQISLVYGGASVGLMGVIADATLQAGGDAIGVIPQSLVDKEIAHPDLTQMYVVSGMHERKALMADLSDGFIALPGGIGTLEELFEIWTWAQLGMHHKPCVLLDVAGYYNQLIGFLDQMTQAGYLKESSRSMLKIASNPLEAISLCLSGS
ncbi:MAG: TIGR00730 family Rossman fold protein [Arenicellales bacterium]|nr:TIGR00730 family Rossman fold protein [Arenicellales bacterium]